MVGKQDKLDKQHIINIAIDGPSGAGKSTVAKLLALKLDILYLDTGAMYRCLGLKALNLSIDIYSRQQIEKLLASTSIEVQYIDGTQHSFLDKVDVSKEIRKHEVSKMASDISALPPVRFKMANYQADIASKQSCVLDGRDIGTFVLPNAQFKFFLTADAKTRAERRYKELLAKGQDVAFDKVYTDIISRDNADSSRAFAPLLCADDAVVIDTSSMDVEQVVCTMLGYISN